MKRPTYDCPEPCHSCGAMPTSAESGLCRHCDDGGDVVDDDYEPREPDGGAFRGRESSSFDREQQASIMRDLKR